MNFDFADILLKVVEHKASDLHITSGAPPTIRVRGSLVPLEGMPNLTPTDTREIVYAILSSSRSARRSRRTGSSTSPTPSRASAASVSTPSSSAARSAPPSD